MHSSHPDRTPRPLPGSQQPQSQATPNAASSDGSPLLRICCLLLGSTIVVVFGLSLIVVLLKGPNPNATAPEEKTIASNESGMQSLDSKPAANDRPHRLDEVDRVLGGSFHAPARDDAPSFADTSAPLPPPPLKPHPTTPLQPSPLPLAPPQTPNADGAFEKRLQANEEDLRQQLLSVPEVRLFSDLVVQNFREKEKSDERTLKGVPKDQIDFAYNAQLNKYLQQAALKEGLPLLSGPNCQLDADTAMLVQNLSKDLRDMGFVSVPGTRAHVSFKSSRKAANAGAKAVRNGPQQAKVEAFKEWCDVNTVEKFRGALATLLQVLQVEDVPMRLLLVRELAKAQGPEATAVLANRAMVDLAPEVRQAAVAALEKRPSAQYVSVLLQGLRYPWPPVADHAALALRKLKPQRVVNALVDLLDRPDPSLPVLDKSTNKPAVRELVRLNHMRNCLLCHAPSAHEKDGLVRGLVPTPGQPLPRLYYAGQKGDYVRADMAFLRQDFSVNLPVSAATPWPNEQRFDFVTRVRPAKAEEMTESAAKPSNYPQRDAVLYALRGLTGKDGGDKSAKWRTILGIDKNEKQ